MKDFLWLVKSSLQPAAENATPSVSSEATVQDDFYAAFIEKFVNPVLNAAKELGEGFSSLVSFYL